MMTKAELKDLIDFLFSEDDDDVCEDDICWAMRDYERDRAQAREERIAELEERQMNNGFYEFQDLCDLRRRER